MGGIEVRGVVREPGDAGGFGVAVVLSAVRTEVRILVLIR